MRRSRAERWNAAYAALKKYRKEHPGQWPRSEYVAADGFLLGMWCHNQRKSRKRGALALDRVRKLKNIGFPWIGTALRTRWEQAFEALSRFHERHGHCRPRETYVDDGVNLHHWCHQQRVTNKNGKLMRDRVRKLDGIDFEWEPYDDRWEKGLLAFRLYRRQHPNRRPRVIEILPDGFKLGSWCAKQRKLNKLGILPKDRKRRLNAIGFEWEPEEALWKRAFWILRLYRRDNPNRWPPRSYVTTGGFRLGAWCQNKRTNMKRGVLSKDHLAQLKKIGFA